MELGTDGDADDGGDGGADGDSKMDKHELELGSNALDRYASGRYALGEPDDMDDYPYFVLHNCHNCSRNA